MLKRCGACQGALFTEPIERIFQVVDGPKTELRCLARGRSPGDGPDPAPRQVCRELGCLKDRAPTGDLCAGHRARQGRRVGA